MLAITVVCFIAIATIFWIASSNNRTRIRRRAVAQMPFPTAWRRIIKQRVPYFRYLPAHLQLELKKHIKVFLAEKKFVGCDGLSITPEIKVTIAAQACLLLLNDPRDYYPKLKQILVYPSAFKVKSEQTNELGLIWEEQRILAGESWGQGKIVLSWIDTLAGAKDPFDGSNVVIHEFAHQLDQQAGVANGAPQLNTSADYTSWSKIFSKEYERLRQQKLQGIPSLFSHYGATNPAEFFAVVSEVFFEQPNAMANEHPELYSELSQFYRLDPQTW